MVLKKKTRKVRNPFEARLKRQLARAKVSFKYETEKIPYVLVGHYIPDFILSTRTGNIYIEAKGYFRREAKAKMLAVKRQHPAMDIRFVFYKYSKAYERWAIKNGFKYAFEKIPKEWLND